MGESNRKKSKSVRLVDTNLSPDAEKYYEELATTLGEKNQRANDTEIMNYAFETLSDLEKIIGDPVTFIEQIMNREKIIYVIPKNRINN